MIRNGDGLFCANFSSKRGGFDACRSSYCHKHYTCTDDDDFRVNTAVDKDGEPILRHDDSNMFQYGRRGDHAQTPFQCDRCHYQNMFFVDQDENDPDEKLLRKCLRRSILDSLWSRKCSTVGSNYSNGRALERYGRILGFNRVMPEFGPYPLEDTFGMRVACCLTLKGNDGGKNASTLQFGSTRKYRTAFSNFYHSSVSHLKMVMLGKENRKVYLTDCPTDGRWFDRFMQGMGNRLGQQLVQDLAMSVEVLLEVQELLEEDWQLAESDEERVRIAEMGFFFVVNFCTGLRGEETFLVHAGMTKTVHELSKSRKKTPHSCLTLVGQRKSLQGERAFVIPVATETASGLKPGLWIDRLMEVLEAIGDNSGWAFKGRGTPEARKVKPMMHHYAPLFMEYLKRVQVERPDLIPALLDVEQMYGIARSTRRGATTQARNQGVSAEDIESNQGWRKTNLYCGTANFSRMLHHYTELAQSLNVLLRFSSKL